MFCRLSSRDRPSSPYAMNQLKPLLALQNWATAGGNASSMLALASVTTGLNPLRSNQLRIFFRCSGQSSLRRPHSSTRRRRVY